MRSRRRRARTLAAAAALVGLWTSGTARATSRPDPLADLEGCERWTGKAGGNDPTVQLDVRLCPGSRGIEGQVQWSSLRSGWNLREVSGSWSSDDQTLTLKDVRIIEEKPNPGWRFCTIDRYELTRAGPDRLTGGYHSTACRDDATVSLTRASAKAAPAESDASAESASGSAARPDAGQPSPEGAAPERTPSPGDGKRDGCGTCTVGAPRATAASAWLVALVLLPLRRRSGARRTGARQRR